MSEIEYNNLLFELSESLNRLNRCDRLLFLCRGKLAPGSEDRIQDALSLFKELEDRNHLGPDRLGVLKTLLKGVKEYVLLENVKRFENDRKEYLGLLDKIIPVLDELDDVERLISICRADIPEANVGNICNVRSLLKELENNSSLGTDSLGILKEILLQTEQNDLLRELEKFEERRNREEAFQIRKERASAFMSSVGSRLIGVLNIKTVFKVVAGGIITASTLDVWSRGASYDQLITAVNSCVLPAGTKLIQITEGCVCLTVQGEDVSALKDLWASYQSGTLKQRLQNFFVTDHLKELAEGEQVEAIVTIDEQEFDQAYQELNRRGKEIASDEVEHGRIQPELPNRIEDECQDKGPDGHKGEQSRYLDEETLAFVQKYLESAEDAQSVKTETSDSGMDTRSAPSEFEMEERSESPYDPCLKDISAGLVDELIARLQIDLVSRNKFYKSFGLDHHETRSRRQIKSMVNIKELFPDTPIKLLKDVCRALQLYDLVEICEKAKLRTLRPALPLKEMAKLLDDSNRPTTVYRKANVLIVDNEKNVADTIEKITNLFENICPGSEICSVATTYSMTPRVRYLKEQRASLEYEIRRHNEWILGLLRRTRSRELEKSLIGSDFDEDTVITWDGTLLVLPQVDEDFLESQKKALLQRKNEIENRIKTEDANLPSEIEKIKAKVSPVCEKWSEQRGNQSVILFLFQMVDDAQVGDSNKITDIVIEKLQSFPTEAKVLLTPEKGTLGEVPESLHVKYSRSIGVVPTIFEVLSKRWQTLDLISIMREVQRTIRAHTISISDNLSSIPTFWKIEEQS